MFGTRAMDIPGVACIDSKNLFESVHNIKAVDDRRLIDTIVEIKQAIALDKTVQEIRLVPGERMLADGLTKKNGFCEELLQVLQQGKLSLPGGWSLNPRTKAFVKTWCDLGGGNRMNQILWASQVLTPGNNDRTDDDEDNMMQENGKNKA